MSQPSKMLALGVDLGGTKVEMALVDDAGGVVKSHGYATNPEQGPDRIIAGVADGAMALSREAGQPVQALGIGVAGQVDKLTGMVSFSPNLAWRNVPLRPQLEDVLGMDVMVTNDVRAATWGEWLHGAGRGANDLACLFVGTGVGGGIVVGGHVTEGSHNAAGELGHITIVTAGRTCRCPNRGCLEAYVGGWAIAERAREAVRGDAAAGRTMIELAGSVEQISARTVSRADAEGDRLARHLVEETARYLAAGVVGIVNAFNPELLILGGSVMHGIPRLISLVEPDVRAHALEAAVEGLRIVIAELGGSAGVIGAAALARSHSAHSS